MQMLIAIFFAVIVVGTFATLDTRYDYTVTLQKAAIKLRELNTLIHTSEVVDWKFIGKEMDGKLMASRKSSIRYDNIMCYRQFEYLMDGLNRSEEYALEVFDAWGRLPSGILSGNLNDFGNFDQCLQYSHKSDDPLVGDIHGQHCMLTVSLGNLLKNDVTTHFGFRMLPNSNNRAGLRISMGICVPAECEPATVKTIADQMLARVNLSTTTYNQADFCHVEEEVRFTTIDWVAIFIFGVTGLLMVASTIYEVYTKCFKKPQIPILKAFSVYTNSKKLFAIHHQPTTTDHIGCINGIRVLSIVWVVFCHGFLQYTVTPLQNAIYLTEWITHYTSMLVVNGTLSVDTFFLLSGMLLTMAVMKELDKNGKLNLPLMYVHRYLRLTPAFAALILFSVSLIRYTSSGPYYLQMEKVMTKPCEKYWWSALLFVQNYVNPKKICVGHSWYLSVDMQLYVLSPLLLYPLWRFGKKILPIIILMILATMTCAFVTMLWSGYKVGWTTMETPDRMTKVYYPTHVRMHTWLVGVLLGYLLHLNRKTKFELSKSTIATGWVSSITVILCIMFGCYPMQQLDYTGPVIFDALFESTSRVFWGISVSWIIFACINGYGGFINNFLSLPLWQPLVKLSYSIYLIHMTLQTILTGSVRHSRYFSNSAVMHSFWGDFGLTLTISIVWTLAFESPIVEIEKYLLEPLKRQRQQPTNSNSTLTLQIQDQSADQPMKEC